MTKAGNPRLFHFCEFQCGNVYNTHMNSADIIKQLLRSGWVLRGVKGSHHIYTHPERGGHISVPHPKKDLGVGLSNKLLKQAGLK
jgi:predicted RNA binding protein YcfA (HicA-like mRNA interferase family)